MKIIAAIPAALLAADLDGNGRIDGADTAKLITSWKADSGTDLANILTNWGTAWVTAGDTGTTWLIERGDTWRWLTPDEVQFGGVGEFWSGVEVEGYGRIYVKDE